MRKPKTVREWFKTLPKDICKQAIAHTEAYWEQFPNQKFRPHRLEAPAYDLHEALMCSFEWSQTPQGFDYWQNIARTAPKRPPGLWVRFVAWLKSLKPKE